LARGERENLILPQKKKLGEKPQVIGQGEEIQGEMKAKGEAKPNLVTKKSPKKTNLRPLSKKLIPVRGNGGGEDMKPTTMSKKTRKGYKGRRKRE